MSRGRPRFRSLAQMLWPGGAEHDAAGHTGPTHCSLGTSCAPCDGKDGWSAEELQKAVVKERQQNVPLLKSGDYRVMRDERLTMNELTSRMAPLGQQTTMMTTTGRAKRTVLLLLNTSDLKYVVSCNIQSNNK